MRIQPVTTYNQNKVSNRTLNNRKIELCTPSFQQNMIRKIPNIVVKNFRDEVIDPRHYDKSILDIIDAIKVSKGFKRFFEKYSADSIHISPDNFQYETSIGYGLTIEHYVYNTNIDIYNPQLRKEPPKEVEKQNLWNKMADLIFPAVESKLGATDYLSFSFDTYSDNIPNKLKYMSYPRIMWKLYIANLEIKNSKKN